MGKSDGDRKGMWKVKHLYQMVTQYPTSEGKSEMEEELGVNLGQDNHNVAKGNV